MHRGLGVAAGLDQGLRAGLVELVAGHQGLHLGAGILVLTDQRRALQRDTLFGQEAKPLPYMLAQMNLLLHGLESLFEFLKRAAGC